MKRVGLISAVTLFVLWLQPIVEQVFGGGRGNIARIVTSATGGTDESTIGMRVGLRIAAGIVAVPPWWSRSSFMDAVPYTPYNADGVTITPTGLDSLATSVLALLVVGLVLATGIWMSWRRADRPTVCLGAVAVIAVLLAVASLAIMPVGPLGLTPHQMRWLWSIGAFIMFALIVMFAGVLTERPPFARGLVALVAVVAGLNLPAHQQLAGPDSFQEAIPVARSISAQVGEYRTDDAVVFDTTGLRYLEPYSAVVFAAMADAGVDLRVSEAGLVRQLGNARQADGTEPLAAYILEGRAAIAPPDGDQLIAFTSPLDRAAIDQVLVGEQAMIEYFAGAAIMFSVTGENDVAAGRFALTRQQIVDASLDAESFVIGGLAAELIAAGALDLPRAQAELLASTSELRRQLGTTTVAVLIRADRAG